MLVSGIGYLNTSTNYLYAAESNNIKSQSRSAAAMGEVFGNYKEALPAVTNEDGAFKKLLKSFKTLITPKPDNSKNCLDLVS